MIWSSTSACKMQVSGPQPTSAVLLRAFAGQNYLESSWICHCCDKTRPLQDPASASTAATAADSSRHSRQEGPPNAVETATYIYIHTYIHIYICRSWLKLPRNNGCLAASSGEPDLSLQAPPAIEVGDVGDIGVLEASILCAKLCALSVHFSPHRVRSPVRASPLPTCCSSSSRQFARSRSRCSSTSGVGGREAVLVRVQIFR